MSEHGAMTERQRAIVAIVDAFLDKRVGPLYIDDRTDAPNLAQTWARVAKVDEEHGEAISELIAWTGQNPRKGTVDGAYDRLLKELGDKWMAAQLAIQHLTKDIEVTEAVLAAAAEKAYQRAQM